MIARIAGSRRTCCKALMAFAVFLLSFHAQADDNGNASMEGFREIRVAPGLTTGEQLIDVIAPFLRDHPESLEGNASMEMDVRKEDAGFRVDIIKSGFLDDSVQGEHWRGFVIMTSEGQWELLSMAVKNLCYRGNTDDGSCL
ncbi:MAG: hypothetical protein GY789_22905 [Hyphomicrobiales bacterium]|nr:hypothetical protein [Hyphomicrobiales bacterium]